MENSTPTGSKLDVSMEYYKINPDNPDRKIIAKACQCLEKGGIIAFPTDTLYGLGVDVFNRKAVNKLFLVKQRDMQKPVSIMLHSLQQIKEIFGINPAYIKSDLEKIFPGKVTAIIENAFRKKVPIFENVNKPGTYLPKVGVRIPGHKISMAMAKMFDAPISSTSANISGTGNVFKVEDIVAHFGSKLDLILDAGSIRPSLGSTVIDFTRQPYLILREGDMSAGEIKKILGEQKVLLRKTKFVITFVCSGNICRSPMAEIIARRLISKTRYKNFISIQSAGTLHLSPSAAHEYAINVCKENDLDLTTHLSQPISSDIVNDSDLIICLAQDHLTYLYKNYPKHRQKIHLLKQWNKEKLVTIPSVADPIGHEPNFFKETYREIFFELKRILPSIFSEVKNFIDLHGHEDKNP